MADDFVAKICKLDASDLRQIVLGLCIDPDNKDAAAKHMKLLSKENGGTSGHKQKPPQPSASSQTKDNNSAGASNSNNKGGTKRRSSVHTTPYTRQKCENCDLCFTAIDNAEKACTFHPGKKIHSSFQIVFLFLFPLFLYNSLTTSAAATTTTGKPFLDPSTLIWSNLSNPHNWDNEAGHKMFPNGFRWSCCGGLCSTSSTCVAQYHVARDKDTYAV